MQHTDIKTIELKAIKVLTGQSEETHCYEANVYINGKKAIAVGNHGHGGPDSQDEFIAGAVVAANEYLKRSGEASLLSGLTGEDGDPLIMWQDLEIWCGNQVSDLLLTKELKSSLKKKIVYKKAGDIYEVPKRQNGRVFSDQEVLHALKQKPDLKGVTYLNEIPFEEALALFREYNFGGTELEGKIEFMPEFDADGNCTNIPDVPKAS